VNAYRPLPAYEGSIGPLPATEVDNNYLLARYSITKPTLFKRRDALVENKWVTPTRVGQRVYYSSQDVHLLDSVDYWTTNGYNLAEIVVHLKQVVKSYKENPTDEDNAFEPGPVEQVTVTARNTTTDLIVKNIQTSPEGLEALSEKLLNQFFERQETLLDKKLKEYQRSLPRDTLSGHDFLEKAAAKGYLLTGKILADGLGLKNQTISGWGDRTEKFGFVVCRVGKGQWQVSRLPS